MKLNKIVIKKYTIAFSTTDSEEEALKIAETLVEEKLAACVNIVPIFLPIDDGLTK